MTSKNGRKQDFIYESFDEIDDETNETNKNKRFKYLYSNVIVVPEDSGEEDQCSDDGNNDKTIVDQCSYDDKGENYDDVDNEEFNSISNILNLIEHPIDDGDKEESASLLDISKGWFNVTSTGMNELKNMIIKCLPS